MSFLSDNTAPVCPEIMDALIRANAEIAPAYGADKWTAQLDDVFSDIFEKRVAVFPLVTGTAANSIAAAVMSPPYGTLFAYEEAHMEVDECGAPEFFSGGAKLTLVGGGNGKMDADAFKAALGRYYRTVHMAEPKAMSITQSTELGTVYSLDEIKALTSIAKTRDLKCHMDGARFANALATLNVSPADMSWRAGIDYLSFGATKNGAMAAEALIIFNHDDIKDFEWRRKRAGHLISKMRYISAQLLAYVTDDLWLKNARHANAMAKEIADAAGERLVYPVEANEVFLRLSEAEKLSLRDQGFGFYDWGAPGSEEVRLVTAWNSSEAEVQRFNLALTAL